MQIIQEDICPEEYYEQDYFNGEKTKYGYVNYHKEKESSIYNFKKYWKNIARYTKRGRILDAGCATGLFLECAEKNWQRYGLDVSGYASKIARDRIGQDIKTCRLLEAPWENEYFDLITMWDMLDHLPNPAENLLKSYDLLKKQGLLVLNVGDISAPFAWFCGKRWYIMIPPTHLYFFNAQTITIMLNKTGFDVLKIERYGKRVSLRLCFFRLTYIFNNVLINKIFKWFSKSRLGDLKIYFNFYDIMTVYARKR